MINSTRYNTVGIFKPCSIAVYGCAQLEIGYHAGFSGVSISCNNKIEIGNNVLVGPNTMIFDSNFHSLNYRLRELESSSLNFEHVVTRPIKIGDYVFIGANCIIGKGIIIGNQSVVAAGSVVVKSIPPGEVWGGNPARFIKKLDYFDDKCEQTS